MDWQPIDAAPKDGTHILVIGKGPANPEAMSFDHERENYVVGCRVMHWFDGFDTEKLVDVGDGLFRKEPEKMGARWRGAGTWLFTPTHWMPLPSPPTITGYGP